MNRDRKLLSNGFVIGVGSIMVKIAQYVILTMCTYRMTAAEYGLADICVSTAALLVPIIGLGISEAAFRFSVDKDIPQNAIITVTSVVSMLGIGGMILLTPLASIIPRVGELWPYIAVLTAFEVLELPLKEYARGCGKTKDYLVSGIINAIITVLSCFVLLYSFDLKLAGYILALCIGYAIEAIYLILRLRWIFALKIRMVRWKYVVEMLKYTLPLIPNTLMWWIVSISNRYFVLYMEGDSATGIFSISAKIPALITVVTNVFSKAWQMSAIDCYNDQDRDDYFSKVFDYLWRFCTLGIAGCLLFLRLILKILVAPEFQGAWIYAPFLIVATGFSTLQAFVGTVYTIQKDSIGCLKTTIAMALCNLVLNYCLIKSMSVQGAALATMLSYAFVLVYRLLDTKKYINLKLDYKKILIGYMVIILEAVLLMYTSGLYYVITIVAFIIICILNFNIIKSIIGNLFTLIRNGGQR